MSKIDSSKVIVIDSLGRIGYQGDINDSVLHVINLKNYGLSIYGNDFSNITDEDSPNKPCYLLLKEGNIVLLNLSRFGDKFAICYIPSSVNEIQKKSYSFILDHLVGYQVLSNFLDEDMGLDLYGYPVNDSYDDDFSETKKFLNDDYSIEK